MEEKQHLCSPRKSDAFKVICHEALVPYLHMQSLKVYLVGSLLLTNYRRTFEDKISARAYFLSESQALLCKCQFAQKHGQRPLETSTIASLPSLRMLAGPPSRWLISQFLSLSSFAKKQIENIISKGLKLVRCQLLKGQFWQKVSCCTSQTKFLDSKIKWSKVTKHLQKAIFNIAIYASKRHLATCNFPSSKDKCL